MLDNSALVRASKSRYPLKRKFNQVLDVLLIRGLTKAIISYLRFKSVTEKSLEEFKTSERILVKRLVRS